MLNKKTNEYKGSFYHSKNRDDDAVNDIDITFEGIDAMLIYSLTPGSTSQFKHLKVCKGKNDNISIYERELNLTPEEVENLSCRFCGTSFSLQSCYSRHMNTGCKDKILYESDLRERVLENRRKAAEQKQKSNRSGRQVAEQQQDRSRKAAKAQKHGKKQKSRYVSLS